MRLFRQNFCIDLLRAGMCGGRAVNTVCGETMKRFAVIFLLVTIVAGVLLYKLPQPFARYAAGWPSGEVCVYCRSSDLDSIDMGNGRIVRCSAQQLYNTLRHCSGVDGVSVSFDGDEQDVWRITKRFDLNNIRTQQCGDTLAVCGYSAMLCGGLRLDGHLVNLQIAHSHGKVTVGSPLILGSF